MLSVRRKGPVKEVFPNKTARGQELYKTNTLSIKEDKEPLMRKE
jgi:hypothetical protein